MIPPFLERPNTIDESIARKFGRFPVLFRGGLGAPRRQIRILEIGKLEGLLEKNLRNLKTRQRTINILANEIVEAFVNAIHSNQSFNIEYNKRFVNHNVTFGYEENDDSYSSFNIYKHDGDEGSNGLCDNLFNSAFS